MVTVLSLFVTLLAIRFRLPPFASPFLQHSDHLGSSERFSWNRCSQHLQHLVLPFLALKILGKTTQRHGFDSMNPCSTHGVLQGAAQRGRGQFYFVFAVLWALCSAKWAFSTLKLAPPWREPPEAPLDQPQKSLSESERRTKNRENLDRKKNKEIPKSKERKDRVESVKFPKYAGNSAGDGFQTQSPNFWGSGGCMTPLVCALRVSQKTAEKHRKPQDSTPSP